MTNVIQVFLIGLTLGGVYALMSSGLTLVFVVMRIVNIAHAALMLIAAYVTYFAFHNFGLDPILSIVITMPVMLLVGLVVYRLFFSRVEGDERYGELTVLLTFAIALIIEGILGYFFTNIYRSTNPSYATEAILFGPFYLPKGQFYATLISLALIIALWAFMQYTRLGYAIRATMQNPTAAQVVGVVDPRLLDLRATAIVGVSVRPPIIREAAQQISKFREVSYLVMTSGTFDLLIEVLCDDTEHLARFLNDRLLQVEGVQRTETFYILRTYKLSYRWGMPEDLEEELSKASTP